MWEKKNSYLSLFPKFMYLNVLTEVYNMEQQKWYNFRNLLFLCVNKLET